ncbi:MAG: hypothetical protein ACHREM_13510 [Polyangiales bacterium]
MSNAGWIKNRRSPTRPALQLVGAVRRDVSDLTQMPPHAIEQLRLDEDALDEEVLDEEEIPGGYDEDGEIAAVGGEGGENFGEIQGRPSLMQQHHVDFAEDPDVEAAGEGLGVIRGIGRGQFFIQEPSEEFYPEGEVPWGPENPLWVALKAGDVKIVRTASGEEVLVPREAYAQRDDIPTEDFGSSDSVSHDLLASFGQLKYRYAKTMVAYAITDPPQPDSPLLVKPIQSSTAVPPIGGCVVTAGLDFGHRGTPQFVIFDMPPSQIIKAPFAGSFGKLGARLRPKYYTPSDSGAAPIIRVYLAFPGGPQLTNELWNSTQTLSIAQNGILMDGVQSVRGWLAEGFLSNDLPSKPIRRFYGSVQCNGTPNNQEVFCPVAFAATYVQLSGASNNGVGGSTTVLQFYQLLPPTSGVAAQLIGPYPPNQPVLLLDNVQAIVVVNAPTAVGGAFAPLEVCFELAYSLSF